MDLLAPVAVALPRCFARVHFARVRFARVALHDVIPPAGAAVLLDRFARVDFRVQLVPSDAVLLAVPFAIASVVAAVVTCRLATAAALVVATIMLLFVDSVNVQGLVFRPEPVETDVVRKSAVLVPLD